MWMREKFYDRGEWLCNHISTLTLKLVRERGEFCAKTWWVNHTLDVAQGHAYIDEELDNRLRYTRRHLRKPLVRDPTVEIASGCAPIVNRTLGVVQGHAYINKEVDNYLWDTLLHLQKPLARAPIVEIASGHAFVR